MNFINSVAEIISAITVIITALLAIQKFSKGKLTKWLQKPVLDKIESLDKRMNTFEITQLKHIIMNDSIPLAERVDAGDRYISLGGNGAIKVIYKKLKDDYYEQLENKDRNREEVI